MKKHTLASAISLALALVLSAQTQAAVKIAQLDQYKEAINSCVAEDTESCTEIAAYSPEAKRIYVTNAAENGVRMLDLSDAGKLTEAGFIDLSSYGGGPNSVATHAKWLAVAVEAEDKQANGSVVIFDLDGNEQKVIEAGALPDMLTFTPDGQFLLVANEGEPSDDYSNDPEGSVSVISTSNWQASTAGFSAFNDKKLKDVRIFGPGSSVAQDLEPEYIAVDADSSTAWISLQENNALAKLDIASATITDIYGLGFKKHHQKMNAFDASNKDDGINIQPWPTKGMYQPDAITTFQRGNNTFILSANEGDARDYDGYSEEVRVKDLILDPEAFPNAAELQLDENLGRLKTTTAHGDTDGDGDHDEIYSYGGRSFSVWNGNGKLVFDSASSFELTIEAHAPEAEWVDGRSDDKGPEPESITTGKIGDQDYVFIATERTNDLFIYRLDNPSRPTGVGFYDLDWRAEGGEYTFTNDVGPEGLLFVDNKDWLIVTNEISNTVSVYKVEIDE